MPADATSAPSASWTAYQRRATQLTIYLGKLLTQHIVEDNSWYLFFVDPTVPNIPAGSAQPNAQWRIPRRLVPCAQLPHVNSPACNTEIGLGFGYLMLINTNLSLCFVITRIKPSNQLPQRSEQLKATKYCFSKLAREETQTWRLVWPHPSWLCHVSMQSPPSPLQDFYSFEKGTLGQCDNLDSWAL
jgi:hypothetical protein